MLLLLSLTTTSGFVSPQVGRTSKLRAINSGEKEGQFYIDLVHPSGSKAQVYLYGADVTQFSDASGEEWIAVRPDAKMDGSKPISGGLSHCFPQFGPGAIQQHGFARNLEWSLTKGKDPGSVTLELVANEYTRAMWDYEFKCYYTVELMADSLKTTYEVVNEDKKPFEFQAALHSYFDVSSIGATSIAGSFKGAPYIDKVKNEETAESRDEIVITEEYDRVYLGVNDPILKDMGKKKQLKILNSGGWKDTVVWNPYGNDAMGYNTFVCVESVAFQPITLQPNDTWRAEMELVPDNL